MNHTESSSTTSVYENGERVFPCRCGLTHRGNYALEDYMHHDCLHETDLLDMNRLGGVPEQDWPHLICRECGKTWLVANHPSERRHP